MKIYFFNNLLSGVLIFFTTVVFAQQNERSQNTADFILNNWTPSAGQSGAQINQISFNCLFKDAGEQVFNRFEIKWKLGEFLQIKDKKFEVKNLDEEVVRLIAINTIRIKTDVYSEQKQVGDITITLQNMNLISDVVWTISGNQNWNELFNKTTIEDAKEIFKKGFELRNPNIQEVEFINMDIIETLIEEEEYPVQIKAEQAVEESLTFWQRYRKNHPQFIKSLKDVQKGKPNKFRGLSWHSDVAVGINNIGYPLNLNHDIIIRANNVISYDSTSTAQRVGGYGLAGGVQLWPLFGNYVGLGFFSTISMGGTPSLYSFFNLDYGTRIYAGRRNVKLMAEYSKLLRYGTYVDNFQQQSSNGSSDYTAIGIADFQLTRLSLGPRICFDTNIPLVLDFQLCLDKPRGLITMKKNIFTWKMSWWMHNYFCINVEFSPNYPVAGNSIYPPSPDDLNQSHYLFISIMKPFDFFGKPYYAKKRKR